MLITIYHSSVCINPYSKYVYAYNVFQKTHLIFFVITVTAEHQLFTNFLQASDDFFESIEV